MNLVAGSLPGNNDAPIDEILQVFAWGCGRNGRLGLGDERDLAVPHPVDALRGSEIASVYCGAFHSLAVSTSGNAYSWGRDDSGQCGHGNNPRPDQVGNVAATSVVLFSPDLPRGTAAAPGCLK